MREQLDLFTDLLFIQQGGKAGRVLNKGVDNVKDSFSDLWANLVQPFFEGLPTFLMAIVILIIFWFVAKILSGIIRKILKRINADSLIDKLREVDIFKTVDFSISKVAGKLVYWILILTGIIAAADFAGMGQLSEGIRGLLGYVPKFISAIIFFAVGSFIANLIRSFIATASESVGLSIGKLLSNIVFYFLIIIVAITALNQAGINTDIITGNFQIILGVLLLALGLGYGLASKDLMSNLIASFYSKGKFEVGQRIKAGNISGEILSMDNTSVTLKSETGGKVIVPLSQLQKQEVEIN